MLSSATSGVVLPDTNIEKHFDKDFQRYLKRFAGLAERDTGYADMLRRVLNHKQDGKRAASLTLSEFFFSSWTFSNLDCTGLYNDCLQSKGKRFFDAFKRRRSCTIRIGTTKIDSNVGQLRYLYLYYNYGLHSMLQDEPLRTLVANTFLSKKRAARKRKLLERCDEDKLTFGRRKKNEFPITGMSKTVLKKMEDDTVRSVILACLTC